MSITKDRGITGGCNRETETLSIRVHDIKWPDGTKGFPKEIYMAIEVSEDNINDYVGDTIFYKIADWFKVEPYSFDWEASEDSEDDEEDDTPDFLDDMIDAVSKDTVSGRVLAVMSVLADHGLLPSDDESEDDEDDEDFEDDDCGCDCDCDDCPYDDDDEDDESDDEDSSENFCEIFADFLNGLAKELKASKSKDSDR